MLTGCEKNNPDSIHGSLLAISELLELAEDFMVDHMGRAFELVRRTATAPNTDRPQQKGPNHLGGWECGQHPNGKGLISSPLAGWQVLHYREHRNSRIRRAVILLLPRLAQMRQTHDPKDTKQLSKCVNHLMLVLRQGSGESWLTAPIPIDNPYCSCKLSVLRPDRSVAFEALGKLALAAPAQVTPHLKVITQQFRDSTNPRSRCLQANCRQSYLCSFVLGRACAAAFAL